MKPKSNILLARTGSVRLALALATLLSANAASATNLYWDTNGTTGGSGAATGIWGTNSYWNTDSTGVTNTFTLVTTTADNLYIAAGTNGTTGTMGVAGTQAANSITLDDNVAVTLAGGTINLGSTTGAGIFVASGDNAANTISTGLVLGAAATIQNAGTGVLTVSGGISGAYNLALINNNSTAGGITLSNVASNNTGTITNSGTSSGGVTISTNIGTNVTGVTQNSSGSALTLSGVNFFSGDTKSSAGTLIISNNLALQNSALDTSGSGVVTLSSVTTPTFGGLKGITNLASVITSGYGTISTLTLNPVSSSVSNTYSGVIANNTAANLALIKTGLGTQILSGANLYTGTTTISGGTLQIGDGATGSINGTTGTALTFNTYGGIFNVMEAASSTQGMGALTFSAGSNIVTSTFKATTAKITFASLATRGAGATGNFTTAGTGSTGGTYGGVAGNNVINFTTSPGTGYLNQGLFFNGSSYAFYDTAGATAFLRGIDYANDSAAGTESITTSTGNFTAAKLHELISGSGAITNQGSQTITTLNIANANNLVLGTGATLQLNGLLKSGNAAGGIISGGTGLQVVSAGGELVVRTDGASDTLTINTPILNNSTSLLTKTGAGTLTLGATNTYAGATTIVAGKLAESSTGFIADGSALSILGSTAIFDLGANHSDTVASLTLDGGGQVIGSGTSTLQAGSYALKNGTINARIGTNNITKTTTGTVTIDGNGVGGTVNANNVTVSGGGALIIKNGYQFTGNSSTNIGTGDSGNSVTVTGTNTQLSNGGNLTVGGTNGNNNTLTISGGAVSTWSGITLGNGNPTSGNSIVVTGSGSRLYASGNFDLARNSNSNNNSLYVLNGAAFSCGTWYGGYNNISTSSNNIVVIDGSGSSFTTAYMEIMDAGINNSITVSNGGSLTTESSWGTAYFGWYGTQNNNSITVTGANSIWHADGTSNIANGGNSFYINIGNGGAVDGGPMQMNNSSTFNLGDGNAVSTASVYMNMNGSGSRLNFNNGRLIATSATSLIGGSGQINLNGPGYISTNYGTVASPTTLGNQINGTGSLTKEGTGTLTLTNASNSYSGNTIIHAGTLALGATSTFASSPVITVGDAGSSGTVLDLTSKATGFTLASTQTLKGIGTVNYGAGKNLTNNGTLAPGNSIGTLTITGDYTFGSTSTYQVETDVTSSDKIAISGAATIVSGAQISFSGSTGLGKYVLATAASGLGSPAFGGTAPAGYRLAYSATELDLIHKATLGAIVATPAAASIITGGSTAFSFTVNNSAPANSDSLAFSASAGTNTTGAVTGPVSVAPGATSSAQSGLSFNGTAVGAAQSGVFSVSDAAASNSPLSGSVSVDVYDHASGTASGTLTLGNIHTGYTGSVTSSNSVSAANAAGYRVALAGSAGASGNLSLNGLSNIAAGSSGNISATLATGQSVGVINHNFTYTFADSSALVGASSNVGTASITAQGQVYSGLMDWSGASGGNWSANPNWNDSLDVNVHVAPGLDGNFAAADTATFGSASGAVAVHLDQAVSLKAITLNSTGGAYELDSTGGTLKLNNGGGTATVTNSGGSHTISAPVELHSDTSVAVTTSGDQLTLSGNITALGSQSLTKTGDGTVILSGINGYTGATSVAGGVLLVDGSLTGSGAVSVAGAAVLGGSGLISGAVTFNGGTLAPGASIESLATGALTMNSGATFACEINSLVSDTALAADLVKVTGNVVLNGTVHLTLNDLAGGAAKAFAPLTTLSLINYTGSLSGGFFYGGTALAEGASIILGANTWQIHYGATLGGSNFAGDYFAPESGGKFVNLTLTAIPEPGSLLALGCLIGSGVFLRSRQNRRVA